MNFWLKTRKFLTEDVKNEYESKDTAVLLRFLSIASSFYMLFASIYLIFLGNYFFGVISFLFIGLYVGTFIETYENGTMKGLTIFNIASASIGIFFTIFTGWANNFQWILCLTGLLIYFSTDINIKHKNQNNCVIVIILAVLAITTNFISRYKTPGILLGILFSSASCIYYGACIALIGYAFNKKFNSSEEKLQRYNLKLRQMASMDALTGLPNRRSMNDYLEELTFEKNKTGDVYSIAIADLDFFKKINDNYGHDTGDYVLKTVSMIFENTMEGRGKVARWGGEEFLFVFDEFLVDQAYKVLDKMRKEIEDRKFVYKGQEIHVTITIGLEEYYHITGIEGTISKADAKLYKGKNSGRNRVVI